MHQQCMLNRSALQVTCRSSDVVVVVDEGEYNGSTRRESFIGQYLILRFQINIIILFQHVAYISGPHVHKLWYELSL